MSLCERGCHRIGEPDDPTYVRLVVRMRDKFGTYVYRIGPEPRYGPMYDPAAFPPISTPH